MKLAIPIATVLTLAPLILFATPANDDFSNAEVLTGTYAIAAGTNIGATKQPSEPGSGGLATVWYSWTAPGNGSVEFGLLKGTVQSYVHFQIYRGTNFTNLLLVKEYGSGIQPNDLRLSTGVSQGDKLYVRFANNGGGTDYTGTFTVSALLRQTYPSNDNVAGAVTLSGNAPSSSASLKGATREASEPANTGNNTLWWKWTAPSNGTTVFSAKESEFPAETVLSVFTGSTVTNLTPKMSQTGSPEFSLSTTAGVTYLLAAGSTSATTFGTAIVNIIHSPTPGSASTPSSDSSSNVTVIKAALKTQIASLKRQLSKAKHIQSDMKRTKKIKRLQKQISRLQKQLKGLRARRATLCSSLTGPHRE